MPVSRRLPGLATAPAVLAVAAFYAVYVPLRIRQHGVLWFVHLGRQFLTTSTTSTVLTPSLGWQSPVGYDGQYYYGLAADPANAQHYIGGNAGYIYSRVFYPAVARAAGLGSIDAIPYTMLIANLVAVLAGTFAVALWLQVHGAPTWPAVLFGLYPGLVFTVFRDLTEPLAFALVAFAVLAYHDRRTGRLVASAVLFALALLTRETVLPFVLAAVAALVVADARRSPGRRSWRIFRRGAAFTLAACGPLVVWRLVVTAYLHLPTQERGGGGWAIPFHGIRSYSPYDAQHRLIILAIILPALLSAAAAVLLLLRGESRVAAALLLVNVLLYVVFLPVGVDVDYGAAGRAAIGVVLAAIYCVPAWWKTGLQRTLVGAGAVLWSLAWYLLVASHYGLTGIDLITL